MKRKISFLHLISYIYIVAGLWGLINTDNTNTAFYVFTVGYVFAVMCFMVASNGNLTLRCNKVNRIPIMMVVIWLFGFLVGILKQNNISYMVRNFAGLFLYLVFYFLVGVRLNLKTVEKIIVVLSSVVIIFTLIVYVMLRLSMINIVQSLPFVNCFMLNLDETGYISVWYNAISLLPLGYVCCLHKCFHSGKYSFKDLFIIAGSLGVMMTCARTGGVEIMILGMTAIVYISEFGFRVQKSFLFIGATAVAVVTLFFIWKGINPFVVIFGAADGGNSVRYRQIEYILSNLSVLGHGLGAEYTAIGKGYGIEVIYLDLVYKFGVAVIPIFYSYIYTFVQAIKFIRQGNGGYKEAIPLALMSYTFIALGNPVLFSATSVLCHVIALMIIEQKKYENIVCRN